MGTNEIRSDGDEISQPSLESNNTPDDDSLPSSESSMESKSLRSILDRHHREQHQNGSAQRKVSSSAIVKDFFENTWQKSCCVYRHRSCDNKNSNEDDDNPLNKLINMGLNGLVILLEEGYGLYKKELPKNKDNNSRSVNDNDTDSTRSNGTSKGKDEDTSNHPVGENNHKTHAISRPLFLLQQQILDVPHVLQVYGGSPFSAYLDGCSIVMNHADFYCPNLASVCLDLQKSFPHAYANVYLTPPSSQAVQPHADDRDVLIIQLWGQKTWTIYQQIPIPYPYPDEQVGKRPDLPIPPSVLNGPTLIETVLNPGDVLYMPRGYVHVAQTTGNEPSFHATIAIATHDWTLARTIPAKLQELLEKRVDYRMAVSHHPSISRNRKRSRHDADKDDNENCQRIANSLDNSVRDTSSSSDSRMIQQLQHQIDTAFQMAKEQITAKFISDHLQEKYTRHNNHVLPQRMAILHTSSIPKMENLDSCGKETSSRVKTIPIVGAQAASRITLDTVVRPSTPTERESVVVPSSQPRGLHVREETADAIMEILQTLKTVKKATTECHTEDSGRVSPPSNFVSCKVSDLPSLLKNFKSDFICELTLISFVKTCVELGAMAICHQV